MADRLAGRVAIVTGSGMGIGRGIARRFARERAAVVIAEVDVASGTRTAGEVDALGGTGLFVRADVSDKAQCLAAVDATIARFGRVDVLVNNASTVGPSPMPVLGDYPLDAFAAVLQTNLVAPLHLTQLVLPGMRARRSGLIVNVTSDAGREAYAGWGGYGTSKAALEHLSRVLAAELEGSGVRVYVVDPGDMNTQMHREAEPGVDLSSLPGPESVAPAIVRLLATETAAYGRYEAQSLAPAGR